MENNTIHDETISQKSELQKMIDGENYNSFIPELVKMRKDARILMKKYNDSGLDSEEERLEILTKLFGKHEGDIKIEPPFLCDFGFNIKVGKNFYMNFDCVILDTASVEIGDNVLCGPKVQLFTASHPLEVELRTIGIEFAKKIKIGNNVWIGGGAIVCPGVTIGDNTVIGAGSVVTRNIPSDVVAVGNPCKVIKNLK